MSRLVRLNKLPHLQQLDLSGIDSVDDEVLSAIAKLPALVALNLCECRHITDESAAVLAGVKQLQMVNLTGCDGISAEGLNKLRAGLSNCQITPASTVVPALE